MHRSSSPRPLPAAVLASLGFACSTPIQLPPPLPEAPAQEEFDEAAYEGLDEDEVEFYRVIHGMLVNIGLPGDTPIALSTGRSGPVDPVEIGDASLTLHLIDRDTGEPLASDVVLWRIGAPANAYWTAGDQEVARARVPVEGYRFEHLAVGDYRPVVTCELALAPSAAPIRIAGSKRVELRVDQARERPVRLVLPDLLPAADELAVNREPLEKQLREPPWVVRREVQPDLAVSEIILFGPHALGSGWSGEGPARLHRTPTGFDAGTHPEDGRTCTFTRELTFRPAGPGTRLVSVHIRNPPAKQEPLETLVFHVGDE